MNLGVETFIGGMCYAWVRHGGVEAWVIVAATSTRHPVSGKLPVMVTEVEGCLLIEHMYQTPNLVA